MSALTHGTLVEKWAVRQLFVGTKIQDYAPRVLRPPKIYNNNDNNNNNNCNSYYCYYYE